MLEEIAMLNWVRRLFGMAAESASSDAEFDPVYGLPRRAVEEWLARRYGRAMATTYVVDPTLIAGMRLKVGSDVYDGSVKGGLAALEARF